MPKINLSGWYDPDEGREDLRQPFNYSGKTIATNGHVAIIVDQDDSFPANDKRKNIIDLVHFDGVFTPLDYALPEPELEECTACGGSGKQAAKQECPECEGDGEIEYDNDYHVYNFTCETCDGDGYITDSKEQEDCFVCSGSGKKYNLTARVIVSGIPINPVYYQLLKAAGDNLQVAGNPEAMRLHFKSNECFGAIMGMRLPVEQAM